MCECGIETFSNVSYYLIMKELSEFLQKIFKEILPPVWPYCKEFYNISREAGNFLIIGSQKAKQTNKHHKCGDYQV